MATVTKPAGEDCLVEVPIRLSLVEVDRLVRVVERAKRSGMMDADGADVFPKTPERLATFARFLLAARRRRDRVFPNVEFGEPSGEDDPRPSLLGAIAADLGGDSGALDAALLAGTPKASDGWTLTSRRAFDFDRRLGSVLVKDAEGLQIIAKGAPEGREREPEPEDTVTAGGFRPQSQTFAVNLRAPKSGRSRRCEVVPLRRPRDRASVA